MLMRDKYIESMLLLLEQVVTLTIGRDIVVGINENNVYYVGLYKSNRELYEDRIADGDEEWYFKTADEAIDRFNEIWHERLVEEGYRDGYWEESLPSHSNLAT